MDRRPDHPWCPHLRNLCTFHVAVCTARFAIVGHSSVHTVSTILSVFRNLRSVQSLLPSAHPGNRVHDGGSPRSSTRRASTRW